MSQKLTFPDGFLWGAATASYQIEGAANEDGRAPSIWDTFCRTPAKVVNGDTGDIACDHYHRYKEDIALMKSIGLQAYRFSIAWPRIIPQGTGAVNQAGLDFYDRLVDELLANDIQPWATLYHWDLPQALEDQGGWPQRSIVNAFVNYADVVSHHLGDRVKNWMTFNEPWVFTFIGYGNGHHAPGRNDFADYLRAVHHMNLAHAGSVDVIKANGDSDTRVGIVLNLVWADPATDSEEDRAAVQRAVDFQNTWFLDPLYKGEYPAHMVEAFRQVAPGAPEVQPGDMEKIKGRPDFLGINFYSRNVVKHNPTPDNPFGIAHVRQDQSEHTDMDWEVSPQSIYDVLKHTHDNYAPGDLYITENGAAFADEVSADGQVHDPRRVAYYRDYLANCHRAIQDGVPLKGYFAWSLLDNFEWSFGYTKRFGIIRVDYDTQERTLKDSAKWYSETIRQNGFTVA